MFKISLTFCPKGSIFKISNKRKGVNESKMQAGEREGRGSAELTPGATKHSFRK